MLFVFFIFFVCGQCACTKVDVDVRCAVFMENNFNVMMSHNSTMVLH